MGHRSAGEMAIEKGKGSRGEGEGQGEGEGRGEGEGEGEGLTAVVMALDLVIEDPVLGHCR